MTTVKNTLSIILGLLLLAYVARAQHEYQPPVGGNPGPGVEFVPIPDPAFPETMKQAHIDKLRGWGVIQVAAFADKSEVLKITGTVPAEGDGPKYWRDNTAAIWQDLKSYRYLYIAGSMPGNAINFSDDSFRYGYGPTAVKLYRAGYGADVLPAVPRLKRIEYNFRDAGRINLAAPVALPTALPFYPLGGFMDSADGEILEGSRFPTDVALRCRPGVQGCLAEAFKIEAFVRTYQPQPAGGGGSGSMLSDEEFVAFVTQIVTGTQPAKTKRELIVRAAKQ